MSLKGILWKPGINGLGVGDNHPRLPYSKRFDSAARHHDYNYDLGGTGYERYRADVIFYFEMRNVCTTFTQKAFAWFYYVAVRLVGWLFFNYKKEGGVE